MSTPQTKTATAASRKAQDDKLEREAAAMGKKVTESPEWKGVR